ncbi:MAG: peptidoglycan-binding domain-containing protein, partial [Patescibacteria group bacterium]
MSKLLNKSGASKLVLGLILALAFVGFSFTGVASAQNMTVEQLFQLLSGLDPATLGQLSTMLGGSTAGTPPATGGCNLTRDLSMGSTGEDVRCLQQKLNSMGFPVALTGNGSMGMETTYFGPATAAAVSKFQVATGIHPTGTGTAGPLTRANINGSAGGTPMPPVGGTPTCPAGFNCTPTNVPPATCPAGFTCTPVGGGTPVTGGSTGLTGGAGSIEDADFLSSLSGEEVGEDDDDVAVAGLEIDADAGSDLEITAVRLDFDQGT